MTKKEYQKAYYQKNKTELIKRQKERTLKNKEKVKEYQMKYYKDNKRELLKKQRVRGAKNYLENKAAYLEKSKAWAKQNPERMKELSRKSKKKNKEHLKKYRRKHYLKHKEKAIMQARIAKLNRFGLTPDAYENIMIKQKGACAICGKESMPKSQFYLHVDHCHKTGTVRGILCHHCNAGLGQFRDSKRLLLMAISYLNK